MDVCIDFKTTSFTPNMKIVVKILSESFQESLRISIFVIIYFGLKVLTNMSSR